MAKTVLPVSFRLPPEVKHAVEKAADDNHRSVSSLIEKVLTDYLKRKGYLVERAAAGREARAAGRAFAERAAGERIDRELRHTGQPAEVKAERKRRLTKVPGELAKPGRKGKLG